MIFSPRCLGLVPLLSGLCLAMLVLLAASERRCMFDLHSGERWQPGVQSGSAEVPEVGLAAV